MVTSQRFLGLVGSLRGGSFNRGVFGAAGELLPDGAVLEEFDLRPIPFYDGDVEEQSGFPAPVAELRQAVNDADGVILFTPEYNFSFPALVKNAIDWLSRVPGDSALTNAAVGVVATTPGRGTGLGVQAHLNDSLGITTGRFYPTMLGIGSVRHKMEDGRLTDADTRDQLRSWLADFAAHCAADPEPVIAD